MGQGLRAVPSLARPYHRLQNVFTMGENRADSARQAVEFIRMREKKNDGPRF